MNCNEAQTRLDLYVEGELSPDERRGVETHLRSCPACRRRLANLEQMVTLLHTLPREEPMPELTARILARLEERPRQRAVAVRPALAWAALLSLGVALVVASGPRLAALWAWAAEMLASLEGALAGTLSLDLTSELSTLAEGPAEATGALLILALILLTAGTFGLLVQVLVPANGHLSVNST